MSYEGYVEFICQSGHFFGRDCNDDNEQCPHCGAAAKYRHSVDQTNGADENDPNTFHAQKESNSFEEIENTDHRGNVYFVKREIWTPIGDEWRLLPAPPPQRMEG